MKRLIRAFSFLFYMVRNRERGLIKLIYYIKVTSDRLQLKDELSIDIEKRAVAVAFVLSLSYVPFFSLLISLPY